MLSVFKSVFAIFTVAAILVLGLTFAAQSEEVYESCTACTSNTTADNLRFGEPMLIPGATWNFQFNYDLYDPDNVQKQVPASFQFVNATDDEIVVLFSMGGETQVLTADPFHNQITTFSFSNQAAGLNLSFNPVLIHFAYPLYIGKEWTDEIGFTGLLENHPMSGTMSYHFKVLGQEQISTPAGTFQTLLVENVMTFPSLEQHMTARLWVNEEGILIKRESFVNDKKVQEIELASYEIPIKSMLEQVVREATLLDNKADVLLSDGTYPSWYQPWVGGATNRAMQELELARSNCENRSECLWHLFKASFSLQIAVSILDEYEAAGSREDHSAVTIGAGTVGKHVEFIMKSIQ